MNCGGPWSTLGRTCFPEYLDIVCRARLLARENCGYGFGALKATVPDALASVRSASIRGFYWSALRAIDAYSAGMQNGVEELYKWHRKVEDKSKL